MAEWTGKLLNQLSLRLFKKRISYRHGLSVSKQMGKHFSDLLRNQAFDYIVAPAASAEIAFLQTNIPVLYITDGTFHSCLNYHDSLSNLSAASIQEGETVEGMAISKSKKVIVSSNWAAQSVMNHYGKKKEDVLVIPYGANFDHLPDRLPTMDATPRVWKILFVGVYWKNKGGDIAFRAFKALADKGYPVEMTVLGCLPPDTVKHPQLKVIPFIDKNDAEGQKQMIQIYADHHFLILPTRFDCTPIVINEASAFGVPCLVANSGGVAGHLTEGVNGFLLPYEDLGDGYAQRIEALINNPTAYAALRASTRRCYETTLNWDHWTREFKSLLASM